MLLKSRDPAACCLNIPEGRGSAVCVKLSADYSSPQAARVLMVAFWLSPYTAGALEESSLPEHRHFAPKTIRGTAVLADAFHVSFNMRKA